MSIFSTIILLVGLYLAIRDRAGLASILFLLLTLSFIAAPSVSKTICRLKLETTVADQSGIKRLLE